MGKEWKSEYFSTNTNGGVTIKGLNASKVLSQESVTTPAGTFDTFKIERQEKEYNAKDPSRFSEFQVTLWYAPGINHWVRRTIVNRVENRLNTKETDELVVTWSNRRCAGAVKNQQRNSTNTAAGMANAFFAASSRQ